MSETPSSSQEADAFQRWQAHSIAQLSTAINLFVGLASAALGLGINWLITYHLAFTRFPRLAFFSGLLLTFLSLFFGCVATVTRLLDFRKTAQIARLRSTNAPESEIESLRTASNILGSATWRLFWCQIATFVLGALAVVLSLFTATHALAG